jgi:predicted GH43/DUF377 family glycosyl hydrolase
VLPPSGRRGAFDEKTVDCPFVFRRDDLFYMTYVGFDGRGYQSGLASSGDLLDWRSEGLIAGRNGASEVARYNLAINWIVRENDVFSEGRLKKISGRYLGAYHAYPRPGLEQGPAVIGLCWSGDLRKWEVEPPCLNPAEGGAWEAGGLYKPCILEENGVFYLFYNAKTTDRSWREQTGVATSVDLRNWKRHAGNPVVINGPAGSPDERFASDPCVLGYGKGWAFFYYGLDRKGVARDLLGLSPDLFHPRKCDGVLIDVGPPGSVDEKYAHKPSIISHRGTLYHFYCAVSKQDRRGISVALSSPVQDGAGRIEGASPC